MFLRTVFALNLHSIRDLKARLKSKQTTKQQWNLLISWSYQEMQVIRKNCCVQIIPFGIPQLQHKHWSCAVEPITKARVKSKSKKAVNWLFSTILGGGEGERYIYRKRTRQTTCLGSNTRKWQKESQKKKGKVSIVDICHSVCSLSYDNRTSFLIFHQFIPDSQALWFRWSLHLIVTRDGYISQIWPMKLPLYPDHHWVTSDK